jgi:uncharacterized protein (TIGR04255 family)
MNPFTEPLPAEVPLPRAPLVRVLCQIRFPAVLSVESQEFVAPFQEELRSSYPVLRQEQTEGFMLGPSGFVPSKAQTAWRFHDLSDAWRLSLTSTFVALETSKYTSRAEFMERLGAVVAAAERHIKPTVADRIGIRYLDRLDASALGRLPELVRPELVGINAGELSEHIRQSVTESVFLSDSAQMLARWGQLAEKTTMDPEFMPPLDTPSWILDVDMSSKPGDNTPFTVADVLPKARGYAERIYAFFRWCIKDEFLRYYGGQA